MRMARRQAVVARRFLSIDLKRNPKRVFNPMENIVRLGSMPNPQEKLMNAPTSPAAAEKLPVQLDVEAEISKLVEEEIPKSSLRVENDVERIRSSVTRLASNSIDGLEALTSELQELQKFLKSEVERVQGEIESALAGIEIIVETIAPWKSTAVSPTPPASTRAVRAGPAANVKC